MASQKMVTVTKACTSRKTPSSTGKVHSNLKKGFEFAFTSQVTNKDKKVWYKIASNQYVYSGNCKVWVHYYDDNNGSSLKDTKNADYLSSDTAKLKNAKQLDKDIKDMVNNATASLESAIDGSMRLFGLPHQLTENNDYRISKKTKLGTMFTETFIMDAPLIYIKPGGSNFLPGMTEQQKKNFLNAIVRSASKEEQAATFAKKLANMKDDDWRYFDFEGRYPVYIANVNKLCRLGAVFLDINDVKVPWCQSKTYGTYSWAHYRFASIYQNDKDYGTGKKKTKDYASLAGKTAKDLVSKALSDDEYVKFYVDANTSFSESASNGTTESMVSQFTSSIESVGKELAFVSGLSGAKVDQLVNKSTSTIDDAVNKIAKGDGEIATFLKRLTGVGKQILAGSNFLTPEIWSSSDYSKSYSFSMSLATPYGNREAWYLNIFVPLMHILALALPMQESANTYAAPMLVRAFSPGWFSCDLGIIDSIGIEKGGSGDAWSISGLPNEIKVTVSIKDLYANLAIPNEKGGIKAWFSNTSLMNYLMVNCGVDVTKQTLDDKVNVFVNLLMNHISDTLSTTVNSRVNKFYEGVRNVFNLFS